MLSDPSGGIDAPAAILLETPDEILRRAGVTAALLGLVVIWLAHFL